MGFLGDSLKREVRRFGGDRMLVIVAVIVPVLLAMAYVAMFARGTVRDLPIGVYDGDQTPASKQLVTMLNSTPTIYVKERCTDLTQARELMARGEIDAIVNIPQGLESRLLSGGGAQATAFIDGTYITKGALIQKEISLVFEAFNIGVESKVLLAKGMSQAESYSRSYPVVMDNHVLFNPFGSYAYYLLPGLLPLVLVILVSVTTVYVLGSELRYGTAAECLRCAGGNMTRVMISKLLPYFTIYLLLAFFYNTILYRFLGLPFMGETFITLVVANIMLILGYMAIPIICLALTSNMRLSLSLSGAIAIASFSFSGLTFPHVAMYPAMAACSEFLPFTHYINVFIEHSMRGAPLSYVVDDIAKLWIFTLVAIPFIPLLKKRYTNSKFYHKL